MLYCLRSFVLAVHARYSPIGLYVPYNRKIEGCWHCAYRIYAEFTQIYLRVRWRQNAGAFPGGLAVAGDP